MSVNPSATFDGEPAFEVQLSPTGPGLGGIPDRYVQYRAELISDTGTSQGALLNSCVSDTSDRDRAIELADILADYNEGAIGPGHCEDVENLNLNAAS